MSPSLIEEPLKILDKGLLQDPFYFLFFLIAISLVPFIAILTTSFAKIVVVLSLMRHAIGTPSAPPNIVIIALALILTIFSMYPVFLEISSNIGDINKKSIFAIIKTAKIPLKNFMIKHTKESTQKSLLDILNEKDKNSKHEKDDLIVLVPSFLVSELSLAFQIGFLVFLPFVVIDLIIANLLMALGMQMLSPTTVSLPFKILLFVLVDGFSLLVSGLVKG